MPSIDQADEPAVDLETLDPMTLLAMARGQSPPAVVDIDSADPVTLVRIARGDIDVVLADDQGVRS